MQVSVEKESAGKCKLTIVVPPEKIDEVYKKLLNHLAKTANIKGFRKGKAPKSYIEQQYGQNTRFEAINEVIQSSLQTAIKDEKLNPITTPQVVPSALAEDKPLEFTATFEVLPEVAEVHFSMEKIEKPKVEVTEEDTTFVLEQLRKQYAKWTKIDREAREGDVVVIDYQGEAEGKAIEKKVEDFALELGSKKMIPGFEQGLVGVKSGENRKLQLKFPEDFYDKEYAGKPVEFEVFIREVFETELPETGEDFIKKLGIASGKAEDLHAQIRQTLEIERDRVIREKTKGIVFQELLKQNTVEVPESLIEREANNIHDSMYKHQHDHSQHNEQELANFKQLAKERVSLSLMISAYAQQKAIQLDENKLIARIKEIALAYENPSEVANWLKSDEKLAGIRAQVLEDQVLEKLCENIPTEEVVMRYADLKNLNY